MYATQHKCIINNKCIGTQPSKTKHCNTDCFLCFRDAKYITDLIYTYDSPHAVFITSHLFGSEIIAVVLKAEECSAVRGCGL